MLKAEEEVNKQTKLNAGAATMRNGNCMDVHLAFDINTTIEEFMAMISTQHKQKNNHAKTRTTARGKKRRIATPFHDIERYYSARRRIQEWRCAKH